VTLTTVERSDREVGARGVRTSTPRPLPVNVNPDRLATITVVATVDWATLYQPVRGT